MKTKMKTKKAQEEMIGFVMIIVILLVIALVFLTFALRKPSTGIWQHSAQADDFLQAILAYTTECELGGKALSVRELIIKNYEGSSGTCDNGNSFKEELKSTLEKLLQNCEASISAKFIHGYTLKITPPSRTGASIEIKEGETTGSSFISTVPISLGPLKGNAEIKLIAWYPKRS